MLTRFDAEQQSAAVHQGLCETEVDRAEIGVALGAGMVAGVKCDCLDGELEGMGFAIDPGRREQTDSLQRPSHREQKRLMLGRLEPAASGRT